VRKGKSQVRSVYGFALHHYAWISAAVARQDWFEEKKGTPSSSIPSTGTNSFAKARRMESMINNHWQALAEEDPDHSIKLVVDEWAPGTSPAAEATPGDLLEQMIHLARRRL